MAELLDAFELADAAPGADSDALVFGWRAVLTFRHVAEPLFDLVMTPIMFTRRFTCVSGGADGRARRPSAVLSAGHPGADSDVLRSLRRQGLSTDIVSGLFDRFRSLPVGLRGAEPSASAAAGCLSCRD